MTIKPILNRYGQSAVLNDAKTNKSVSFKAFIQALRYKNKLYLRGTFTELGRNQQDYYLYIGPPDVELSVTDTDTKTLTVDKVEYIIDRVEDHYIGNTIIYRWAIVHPAVADNLGVVT